MLNIEKNITFSGKSIIDGKEAEGYTAVIKSEKPQDMVITSWQIDGATYKENRVQCRKDKADFEDAAYAMQDEMIAALSAEE